MSKMSQLQMELNEQAVELGFDNLEQAQEVGYQVDYRTGKLVLPVDEQLDQAHKEWLNERGVLLKDLENLKTIIEASPKGEKITVNDYWLNIINHTINFIKKGEI